MIVPLEEARLHPDDGSHHGQVSTIVHPNGSLMCTSDWDLSVVLSRLAVDAHLEAFEASVGR